MDVRPRTFARLAAAVVLACHLIAGLQFVLADRQLQARALPGSSGDPVEPQAALQVMETAFVADRWRAQYLGLLVLSVALAAAAAAARTPLLRVTVFSSQLVVLLVATYANSILVFSELTLTLALIVEAHVLFGLWPASFFSGCAAGILVLTPRADSAWGFAMHPWSADPSISAALYAAVMVFVTHFFHNAVTALEEERRHAQRLNQSVLQLTSANVGFQDYATSAERRSSQQERNRITREVHDAIGYTLTNVVMMMEAAQDLIGVDSARLRRTLISARMHAQEALAEIRKTLRSLRQVIEPESDPIDVLAKLFRTFEAATGVELEVEYRNLSSAPRMMIDAVVYRTVQEGLTNAFRHGRATRVTVLFWYDGRRLSLSIRDNGVGAADLSEGIGLRGMRERVEPLGGEVHAGGMKGGGFELRVSIPTQVMAANPGANSGEDTTG